MSEGVFKIEVRDENEEIVIERTWEKSAMPWSWPVPFVAFSGYTQNPMLFKFRSCKGRCGVWRDDLPIQTPIGPN